MRDNKKRKNPFESIVDDAELEEKIAELENHLKDNPEEMKKMLDALKELSILSMPPITEGEWSQTNPTLIKNGSDRFYARLASDLQIAFAKINMEPNIPKNLYRYSAMGVTAYLEDLISDFGVWDAVKEWCKKRIGKPLPFYDTSHEDYYPDDINIEDIKFIIWQAFVRCGQIDGRIFSPYSGAVEKMSEVAFELLVEAFDKAPNAQRDYDLIRKYFAKGDYYQLRSLGIWLGVDFPLTAVPMMREQIQKDAEELEDIYESRGVNYITFKEHYYHAECNFGWLQNCSMAGVPVWNILASMARKMGFDTTADLLDGIKTRKYDTYFVDGTDPRNVILTDFHGETFNLSADSYAKRRDFSNIKGMATSIVKFGDKWMQNGMSSSFETEPKVRENNMVTVINFPENMKVYMRELIKRNHGRQVFYCKNLQEASDIVKLGQPLAPMDTDPDEEDNFLLIISETQAPLLLPNACEFFADPENPFYEPNSDPMGMESLYFITSCDIPEDAAEYIWKHKLLPLARINASQGEEVGKAVVQDNMPFLYGFYSVKASSVHPDSFVDEYDEWDEEN